jgi:phage-related holin
VKAVNVQTIMKLKVVMITFGHATTIPAAIFFPVTKESVTMTKATMEAGIKMPLSPSRKMQARTAVTVRETA